MSTKVEDQAGTEAPEPAEPTTEPTPDERPEAIKEAAKYRTRLRETETDRDALKSTVEALQHQIIAGIITDRVKVSAEGVFAVNAIADFLDDDGQLDESKVVEVATETATRLGLAFAPREPRPDSSQGARGAAAATATWAQALHDRKR